MAAVILLIAMLGVAASIAWTARSDANARESTEALNAARAKMEELRGMSQSALPALDRTNFAVSGISGGVPIGAIEVDSRRADLLDITVTISWTGVAGRRNFSLRSEFAVQ